MPAIPTAIAPARRTESQKQGNNTPIRENPARVVGSGMSETRLYYTKYKEGLNLPTLL